MNKRMILRKMIILLTVIIVVFTVACTQEEADDKVGAYTTAIEKLYEEDSALNSDIQYIAIDTSTIVNLDDEEKYALLKELEDYGYTVLDRTMDELEEEGYVKDLYFEEGIFFEIEDVKLHIIVSTDYTFTTNSCSLKYSAPI